MGKWGMETMVKSETIASTDYKTSEWIYQYLACIYTQYVHGKAEVMFVLFLQCKDEGIS